MDIQFINFDKYPYIFVFDSHLFDCLLEYRINIVCQKLFFDTNWDDHIGFLL